MLTPMILRLKYQLRVGPPVLLTVNLCKSPSSFNLGDFLDSQSFREIHLQVLSNKSLIHES